METIKGFKDSWILTENGLMKTNLIIDNGIIKSIGDETTDKLIKIDDDKMVIPGLIDQHTHGAANFDVIDGKIEGLFEIACSLAQEGVTAFLPTTTTQSIEVINKSLKSVKDYIDKKYEDGAEVVGVHLEGPFISKDYAGAQIPEYILEPSTKVFKKFEKASGNSIKLVTVAVEEDHDNLIEYLKSKDIIVSIGHTKAGYKQVKRALEKGASCVTHTYNGMKPLHHRDIGTVGSTFLFDELYAELICDGVHSSIQAIKVLWKTKPSDKTILITDSLRQKNMPDGKYYELDQIIVLKGKEARLEDGTLAGSVLKLNEAVKNLMVFTGTDLVTAIKCATENPAKNLGIFDKMGSIKENKLANFAIVDKDMNVYQTIRNGKIIYKKS